MQLMMNMLNGLERTRAQFEVLLAASGFKIIQIYYTRGAAASTYSPCCIALDDPIQCDIYSQSLRQFLFSLLRRSHACVGLRVSIGILHFLCFALELLDTLGCKHDL